MRRQREAATGRGTGDHHRGAGDSGRAPGRQREPNTHTGPTATSPLGALAACGAVALCLGCGRLSPSLIGDKWAPDDSPVRLAAGDSVEIKFYYAPELNETQTVRPDGMVSLELVGEVKAAGRTPAEFSEHLGRVYAGQLLDASAAVIVRSYGERRVLVAGAVTNPGPVEMPGRMTALEAIMLAGGFDAETAETRSVLLVRRGGDGVYRGTRLDLKRAIDGGLAPAVHLRPLDILYVPRTRIVKINQWISQHVSSLVPRLGLTYTKRTTDSETIGVNLDGGR
ncbi:MAG: polysaccharide biosynthesis/export family protein [Planctomycetota bacterium]